MKVKTLKILASYSLLLTLFTCLASLAFIHYFVLQPLPGVPSFEKVRNSHLRSDSLLLDRNGEIIHEWRTDKRGRRLDWTSIKDISPAMQTAILAGEDRRFYTHRGVDWISVAAAGWSAFDSSRMRGASTVTMQLASMLDEELDRGGVRRSAAQKIRQARAARALEKSWSKTQILEAYLNLVVFRGELQGVDAAARGLFGKEPQGLKDCEAIVLAALVRAPNAGIETVKNRALALAETMQLHAASTEIKAAIAHSLGRPYFIKPQIALAPHVARRLFSEMDSSGERQPAVLGCSLDGRLQSFTAEALRHHVLSARNQNMHDGAALVVDNKTGEVLAYVGNIGVQSSAKHVDGVQAARQAGSTLKPFLYALAFEKRHIAAASLIEDSPLDVPAPGGVYRPKNYDNLFHGPVTARVALASSLNVPAVKTLNLVGVDSFVECLGRFGFGNLEPPEFYGPSLALGAADVSLWNLVNAYRTLANGGVWRPCRMSSGTEDATFRRAVSAEAAFLTADILSDREGRSRTFALENPMATRYWTAVKTGTSQDMRDNWCIGFSDRFTVGVWAGNFSGQSMWDVSGVTGAAPVWVEVMNWLHRRQSSRKPLPPSGLVRKAVRIGGVDREQMEWFFDGEDSTLAECATRPAQARILYPAPGTIVALDPDIPENDQKMFFEASQTSAAMEWRLDGRIIGRKALTLWAPEKGKHVLKLVEGSEELDSVDFEVRGN